MTTPITNIDLTGFTSDEPGRWTNGQGLVLTLHYFPLVPDLPASLSEPARLQHGLAHTIAGAGAGLIEAVPGTVDGVPAVRQLVKVPRPNGTGQVFLGSWTVPKASCSAQLKIQAAENGPTGLREAVVFDRIGRPEAYFRPHPYAPELRGPLPYHVADHEEWDAMFPGHPLTLVREALRRITPTITLDERFKAIAGF